MRNEFTYAHVRRCIEAVDPRIGQIVSRLYEHTIEDGGHPNPSGTLSIFEHSVSDDHHRFDHGILSSGIVVDLAIKRTAQVGVCALNIFGIIFRERFDTLQITDRLRAFEAGL